MLWTRANVGVMRAGRQPHLTGAGIAGARQRRAGLACALLAAATILLHAVPGAHAQRGCEWSPLGFGIAGTPSPTVYALTVLDDGSGPALYVGGMFTAGGSVPAPYVARWDGVAWSPLGSGMDYSVLALAAFDDGSGPALYAGGSFIIAGGVPTEHVAKWDGATWSPLGSGTNERVHALTVFDDGGGSALYAGGQFTSAYNSRVIVNHIAKWDGSTWHALGSGIEGSANTTVWALTVFDDGSGEALYAGGLFFTAGGNSAKNIAKWDGVNWSPLGIGMTSYVLALTVFDDGSGPALYAAGYFTSAGGVSANRVAKWDGATWSPLGSGTDERVYALTVFDDGSGEALYAGGRFTTAGAVSANRIAKWDGATWSALDSGMSGGPYPAIRALTVFDDGSGPGLHAGGGFITAGGNSVNCIAKWTCQLPGDLNCDGVVNDNDIGPFVLALVNPVGYATAWPDCNILNGDINGDGDVNVFDIDPFVELLTGG